MPEPARKYLRLEEAAGCQRAFLLSPPPPPRAGSPAVSAGNWVAQPEERPFSYDIALDPTLQHLRSVCSLTDRQYFCQATACSLPKFFIEDC